MLKGNSTFSFGTNLKNYKCSTFPLHVITSLINYYEIIILCVKDNKQKEFTLDNYFIRNTMQVNG
jgi:hypothetical protein